MIVDEMIEFYRRRHNLTEAEMERRMAEAPFELAREWRQRGPSTPGEVAQFYRTVDYTLELLRYHNLEGRREDDLDIVIEVRAKNRRARVLDYGCGIGVIGFMLKDMIPTLTVELYDLPCPALNFARDFNVYRPRPVEFVNTFDIRHRRYDFIICNDVLEHLPDEELEETIRFLQDRLASPYSKIFTQIGFYYEPHVSPMHFEWNRKRCDILRQTMRWEYWDVNHDFLNLVMQRVGKGIFPGASIGGGEDKTEGVCHCAAPSQQSSNVGDEPLETREGGGGKGQISMELGPDNGKGKPEALDITFPGEYTRPVIQVERTQKRELTRRAVLYVGFACNIRCKFCYYAYNPTKDWHSLEECKRDAHLFRVKYNNRFVDITGGEPTIYPHFYELLDYCNSIGLIPSLITNVQVLHREDRARAFKEHGVYDFLCSVHALGDTYNELTQTKNGWDMLVKWIDNLNRLDIPWRVNCTMMKTNMTQLRDIAQWVHERGARVINFINFNPFEEWQSKMDIDFQARHSQISPYLIEALEYCDKVGLEANVRYFPFCWMKGHEEKCYNFQQLSYDPHEWDFCS